MPHWIELQGNRVLTRIIPVVFLMFYVSIAQAQTLTVAGGQTIRTSTTEHDAYRLEMNFGWKPEIWSNDSWTLSLNHALGIMTFRDKNNVNAISWAPNIILSPGNKAGFSDMLRPKYIFSHQLVPIE